MCYRNRLRGRGKLSNAACTLSIVKDGWSKNPTWNVTLTDDEKKTIDALADRLLKEGSKA